jgi:outer membrane protein assembly factor BamB
MFGFVASGGRYNPFETTLTAQNVGTLVVGFQAFASGLVISAPVVGNGIAYFSSNDGNVYAVDATTGALIWQKQLPAMAVANSPAVVNGILYIGASRYLYALNASTGANVWRFSTGNTVNTRPAVANGIVYFGSNDHRVYAVNATTGASIWSYTTGNYVTASPAIANGMVYIGSQDRYFYALNASTGTFVWKYGIMAAVTTSAAVANRRVYVSENGVYALDATTGALLWSQPGLRSLVGPAVAKGVVYQCTAAGDAWALDGASGSTVWLQSQGCPTADSPAIANGVIYFGDNFAEVHALRASDGVSLWTYQMDGGRISNTSTAVVVANGMVYVGAEQAKSLYGFKLP